MNEDSIRIKAPGSTETEFKTVSFRASVTATARTGPAAKKEAKGRIDQILQVVAAFTTRAGIETDRVRTTFAVDVTKDYTTGAFNGYQALYTISFKAKKISEAVALHDALTSIDGVESPTPVFNFDDSPEVRARVFENAASKAKATFESQCRALSYDPERFHISRWYFVPEHRPSGKFLSPVSVTDDTASSSVDITPGRALLEMTYEFEFQRVR